MTPVGTTEGTRSQFRSGQLAFALVVVLGWLAVFMPAAARAWAPGDNGLIAFDQVNFSYDFPVFGGLGGQLSHSQCTGGICVVDPQGVTPEHVISGGAEPAWSPDGRHLAFVARFAGSSTLNTVEVSNPDGSHQITVASNVDEAPEIHSPVWSPDGQSIAYVSQLATGSGSAIWVVHSFGGAWGHPVRIYPETGATGSLENIGRIAWSPDGSQLAFAADPVSTFLGFAAIGSYGVFATSSVNPGGTSYEIDDEHIDGPGVTFNSTQLDWGPGGIDYLVHPYELAVEPPGGVPHQSFSVSNLNGFAVAPFQASATAIPYQYVGTFASDQTVDIFTRAGAHAAVTTNTAGIVVDNVAWQPRPNCPPGTHQIGSQNGIVFCTRVGIRIPQVTQFASYASTRLAAIIACAEGPGCQVVATAICQHCTPTTLSGARHLGDASVRLRNGQLKDVAIPFSAKGRALLRSGAVHTVELLFRDRRSGKVLARRSVPVGRPSSISVGCPAAPSVGSTVSIGGSVELPRGLLFAPPSASAKGASHALLFMVARSDRGMHESIRLHTNGKGRYSGKLMIGTQGMWMVEVVYPGSRSIVPAVGHCKLNVPPPSAPVPTGLKVACPASVAAGSPASISGMLSPGIKGVPVRVTYTESGGATVVDTVTTDGLGHFSDSRTFGGAGQVQAQAAITGSAEYDASISSPCFTKVSPIATTLTLSCPAKAAVKGPIAVSGVLSPGFVGASIRITYTPPTGPAIVDTTTTDASGNYSDSTLATQTGTWTIQSSYAGDSQHAGSTSPNCTSSVS